VVTWLDIEDRLNDQDSWPRYYYDFDRAKLEVEAFLKKRCKFDSTLSIWRPKYQEDLDRIVAAYRRPY